MQEEELAEPPQYYGRSIHGRLLSLRRKKLEKVSVVCEMPHRDRSNLSVERTNSKLKLQKDASVRGNSLRLKHITEPEHTQGELYEFQEEHREDQDGMLPRPDKTKTKGDKLPLLVRESPPTKQVSYRQILSKLVAKLQPRPLAVQDVLIQSGEKSDQTGKSKSKSSRKMPRVVDVFELYDRKKRLERSKDSLVRNNRQETSSVLEKGNMSEQQPSKSFIQESVVLNVHDFQESAKGADLPAPDHSVNTLAKQLANINTSMEKFERLIVQGATVVPELPYGKSLVVRIYENWGDRHYVGLNGVEFYNAEGSKVVPKSVTCSPGAEESDNAYDNQPMNLITGVPYHTNPANSCLMPLSQSTVNTLVFTFQNHVRLSMIRFWNYNCSVAGSYCGAKTVEIKMDGSFLFVGVLQKAEGKLRQYWRTCETVLFTESKPVLKRIAQDDWMGKLDHSRIDSCSDDELSTLNNSGGLIHTRANQTIDLEVFENYGHHQSFRFVKISLYDCSGNELRFRIQEGRTREYPLLARSLHLHILDSRTVQLVTIRNTQDEKALKYIRLTVDGRKTYDVHLKKSRSDQSIYLSTSILYGPTLVRQVPNHPIQNLLWAKSLELILFPQKDSLVVGLNKLEVYDQLGIPLLHSRQARLRCNHPIHFDGGQLDLNSRDWLLGENRLLIRLDFDEVVPLAAISFFSCQANPEAAVRTVHMLINEKTSWCGYLPDGQQQPLTALFLVGCPLLQQRLGHHTVQQQHFHQPIVRSNEGRLMPATP